MLLDEVLQPLHLLLGSQEHRGSVVDRLGLNVQDPMCPVRPRPTSLLHDEGSGVALIEEPQLALGAHGIGGVQEQPTVHQGAVEVGYERSNVP